MIKKYCQMEKENKHSAMSKSFFLKRFAIPFHANKTNAKSPGNKYLP
jgi:hypothetical protein